MAATAKSISESVARPPVAVELTPEGVLAAALPGSGQSPVYAYQALPQGALVPSITEVNLHDAGAVSGVIRNTLAQVSPKTRSVTLILPDSLVRVFVLDFDTLPAKPAEALPVIRFRMRKMVPFDVETAGVSYQIMKQSRSECSVLATIIHGPILAEYEAAVRAAGYEPGVVLSSSLAALEATNSMEAILGANLNDRTLTAYIANGNDLLLYRILDLPEDPDARREEVQRGIAVTAAFYEDTLASKPDCLYYTGIGTAEHFAEWIGETELNVVNLMEAPTTGVTSSMGQMSVAAVVGALTGVV